MKGHTMKKMIDTKSVVEKLNKAEAKRELKLRNRYVVYGYRTDGYFTPNMLCMPKSSERANPIYVANNLFNAVQSKRMKGVPSDLVLVRIGEFNLKDGSYIPLSHKIVSDFADAKAYKETK